MRKRLWIILSLSIVTFAFASSLSAQRKVLVLPLSGEGGMVYRNAIIEAFRDRVEVIEGSLRDRLKVREAVARTGAEFVIRGMVKCMKKACIATIEVLNGDGELITKKNIKSSRPLLREKIIETTESLLEEAGAFKEKEPEMEFGEEEAEEKAPLKPTPMVTTETMEEPGKEERYTAFTGYLFIPITFTRKLEVKMAYSNLYPDRKYDGGIFASMGIGVETFPGAFFSSGWFSHIGIYFAFAHSLVVESKKRYKMADESEKVFNITTSQYEISTGIIGRIPFIGKMGPQLNLFFGYSRYEFNFDEGSYPKDDDLSDLYKYTNPYLPTFTYDGLALGLGFKYIVGLGKSSSIAPYFRFFYKYIIDIGRAGTALAEKWESGHGIEFSIGTDLIFAYGIFIQPQIDILWYSSEFNGEETRDPDWMTRNSPDSSAKESKDLIVRGVVNIGWQY